ncbi:MAG TPA: signal peptidase II, partial [Blastocatellia bacterium]|nr:signal peptidase II [Blastocatellia bacterium]
VIAVVVLLLDQVSKYWVSTKLQDGNVSVISGFLDFSYTENRGIAFGMLNNGDMKWLLIVVSVAAIAVVLFYLLRTAASNRALLISLSLLAGGISGNLIDRIRLGRVIDFIDVYHNLHHWPVFNIADTAISIGALLLAIDLFLAPHTDQIPAEEQAQPVHADSSASQQET